MGLLTETKCYTRLVTTARSSEKRRQRLIVSATTWTTRSVIRLRSEVELLATFATLDEIEVRFELVLTHSVRGALAGVGGSSGVVLAAIVARVGYLFEHLASLGETNCRLMFSVAR